MCKSVERYLLTQAAELEASLAERTQQMSEAETTLKLKEMEFERRVTSLQKEHASKVATVLQQATAVAPSSRGSLQTPAGVLRTESKIQLHICNHNFNQDKGLISFNVIQGLPANGQVLTM